METNREKCPQCNNTTVVTDDGAVCCNPAPGTSKTFFFQCDNCGKEIKATTEVIGMTGECPYCGKDQTVPRLFPVPRVPYLQQKKQSQQITQSTSQSLLIECKACKKQMSKNAANCPHCGEPNECCTTANAKSRSIYIILALLLGGLGIHNAYIEDYFTCTMHVCMGILGSVVFVFPSGALLGSIILGFNVLWVIGDMIFVTEDAKGVPLG